MGFNGKMLNRLMNEMDENLGLVLRSTGSLFMTDSLSSIWVTGAFCKIFNLKIIKWVQFHPPVFIHFQPNFMESMVIRSNTTCYFFGNLNKNMAVRTFYCNTGPNVIRTLAMMA